MPIPAIAPGLARFGVFSVDLQAKELYKNGVKIRLEGQPVQILAMLLQHPGEVVSREEIQHRLWPADTFVDFEHSINAAVKRLREALDDSADTPRFIETLPRRGYRFIYPVNGPLTAETSQAAGSPFLHVLEPKPRSRKWLVIWLAAATLVALSALPIAFNLGGIRDRILNRLIPTAAATRLSLPLPADYWADGDLALSPDGKTVVLAAETTGQASRLYQRRLDEWEFHEIPGTEGATYPFFSPDGQWIAFADQNGDLYRIALHGASAQLICKGSSISGGSWGSDGQIIFSTAWDPAGPGLWRVAAAGGTPEKLATLSANGGVTYHFSPERLPGDNAVLFTTWRPGHASIVALSLKTGEQRTVIASGSHPRYLPTGHLLYVSAGHVEAVAFDAQALTTLGAARVVMDGVDDDVWHRTFDASETGVLAALRGSGSSSRLVWKDRSGTTTTLPMKPLNYLEPRLSPDGRRFVVTVQQGIVRNLWVGSLDRGSLTRLTFSDDDLFNVWTRDGKRILFTSGRGGQYSLYSIASDGSGTPQRLNDSPYPQKPTSLSPDGKTLLINQIDSKASSDIWELSLDGRRAPRPVLRTPASELEAEFSPDGRWVAYESDESGRLEVYVQAAQGGAKQQVSSEGGRWPLWNPNGRELFYSTGKAVMAVPVSTGGATLRLGVAKSLFPLPGLPDWGRGYDLTRDGQKFLLLERAPAEATRPEIDVLLDFSEELRRELPGKQ